MLKIGDIDERANFAASAVINAMIHIWIDMVDMQEEFGSAENMDSDTQDKLFNLSESLLFLGDFLCDGEETIKDSFNETKYNDVVESLFRYIHHQDNINEKTRTTYYSGQIEKRETNGKS